MSEIIYNTVYKCLNQNIQIICTATNTWFCGKTIASILGYTECNRPIRKYISKSNICPYGSLFDTKHFRTNQSHYINISGIIELIENPRKTKPNSNLLREWVMKRNWEEQPDDEIVDRDRRKNPVQRLNLMNLSEKDFEECRMTEDGKFSVHDAITKFRGCSENITRRILYELSSENVTQLPTCAFRRANGAMGPPIPVATETLS